MGRVSADVSQDSTSTGMEQGKRERSFWCGEPHPGRQDCLLGISLLRGQINRVPDEGECSPGLAAMLGPKAEQHDAAFAHPNFGERDSILNLVFAQ